LVHGQVTIIFVVSVCLFVCAEFFSAVEIGSKTAEKNSAQTNRQTDKQTDRQTDTTKIMVTWP